MTNDPLPEPLPQDDERDAINSELAGILAFDRDLYAMAQLGDGEALPDFDTLSAPDPAASADDPGDVAGVSDGGRARARVLPQWGAGGAAAWLTSRMLDVAASAASHAVRSPWYALRGLGACVGGVGRWVMRPEDEERFAADLKAAGSLQARHEVRARRLRGRVGRVAVASAPPGAVWNWIEFGQWGFLPAAAIAASYVTLGVIGWRSIQAARSPQERRVRRRRVRPLSRPFVTEALDIVGCGSVTHPNGEQMRPVVLSSSPVSGGEVMVIDLPAGVPVSRLMKKREDFAGALGRPLECVIIDPQPRVSPQRFELFVAARRLDEKGAPAWAPRRVRRRSFFDPVPVGVDARGRDVLVPLFERHGLIAGVTGMGKTFTARLLLMWAAMDPRVRLLVHNLKGGPDYRAFKSVAHTLRSGDSRSDLEALAEDLRELQAEIARRGRVLEGLSSARVPEGKLTDDVASDEGMGPIMLLIDEPQRAFTGKLGTEIVDRLKDVGRTGRAVGISVQLVSQGGKEGTIPSGILDQLTGRIAHGFNDVAGANIILGSDAHGRGQRATDIEAPGIAYVGTAGGTMVRTAIAKVDLPEVDRIVNEAAEMRREAGMLTGMAADDVPADEHDGGMSAFLRDVLAVWPTGSDGHGWKNVKSERLAALLALELPDHYADLAGENGGAFVSRWMREAGVKVSSQRTPGGEGRGVTRANVERAARAADGG